MRRVLQEVKTSGKPRSHFEEITKTAGKPGEKFNIRDFSVLTHDARSYTAIPNYANKL